MPLITDYDELDLDVMDIDDLSWRGDRLRANFGGGYGAVANVGPPNGLHRWTLSDGGVLPDRTSADCLPVGNQSRFDYIWNFFKDHTTGSQEIFVIEFRGRKYFACFAEPEISMERFTDDLYSGGLEIVQRRVAGFYEGTDGSVFDPTVISDSLWGWYTYDSWAGIISQWTDTAGDSHHLSASGDVDTDGTQQNGRNIVRLSVSTADGYLNTTEDPTIYEAFFVMKVREAAFSTYQGILTADVTVAALVGDNGLAEMANLGFSPYQYWLSGVEKVQADQTAPMNAWGVVHCRFADGITLSNLQIGKDRDIAGRFLKADIGEIILCDQVLSTEHGNDLDGYLMYFWDI
jgi:hypothetical protein